MKLSLTRNQARLIQFGVFPFASVRLFFAPLEVDAASVLIVGLWVVAYWKMIQWTDGMVASQPSIPSRASTNFMLSQTVAIELPEGWSMEQDRRVDACKLTNQHTGETIQIENRNRSVREIKDEIYEQLKAYYHD